MKGMNDFAMVLQSARERASSIILNWGEDSNVWECSIISSGKRFTAFHSVVTLAFDYAMQKAEMHASSH